MAVWIDTLCLIASVCSLRLSGLTLCVWLQVCVCYGCLDSHFVFDCKCVFVMACLIHTLCLIASVCSLWLSGLTLCVWLQVCIRYGCLDLHFVFDLQLCVHYSCQDWHFVFDRKLVCVMDFHECLELLFVLPYKPLSSTTHLFKTAFIYVLRVVIKRKTLQKVHIMTISSLCFASFLTVDGFCTYLMHKNMPWF